MMIGLWKWKYWHREDPSDAANVCTPEWRESSTGRAQDDGKRLFLGFVSPVKMKLRSLQPRDSSFYAREVFWLYETLTRLPK